MCVSVLSIVLSWNAIHVSLSNNFTRNEREAVFDYISRALVSLSLVEDLSLTFVGRHGFHRLFIFAPDISREKEMKIFARALRGLLNSLYLSHPTSLFGFSILLCTTLSIIPPCRSSSS